ISHHENQSSIGKRKSRAAVRRRWRRDDPVRSELCVVDEHCLQKCVANRSKAYRRHACRVTEYEEYDETHKFTASRFSLTRGCFLRRGAKHSCKLTGLLRSEDSSGSDQKLLQLPHDFANERVACRQSGRNDERR